MQTIESYLRQSYFVERELEANSRSFMIFKVAIFGRFLRRPPTLDDLNSETMYQFILSRLENRSRETVRGERSTLRAIWADAHERGLLPNPPSRIRKIKKTLPAPDAWSEDDLRKLLARAAKLRGLLRGKKISRAAYWRMVILTAYNTGLRLGDLERLESSIITGPGSYRVTQHKTNKPLTITITRSNWEAIEATNPSSRKYLIRVLCRDAFYDAFKLLVEDCDLHGGTKMIRKAAGSAFERDNPGEGHKLLGNGREVFLQHYADPTITEKSGRVPRSLLG